jgi:hypothetical protein
MRTGRELGSEPRVTLPGEGAMFTPRIVPRETASARILSATLSQIMRMDRDSLLSMHEYVMEMLEAVEARADELGILVDPDQEDD